MIELDEGADEHEIELQPGQDFEIGLPENPTTGFRWSLEASGAPTCTLIKHSFEPAVGPPGQGGSHHWQFRTVQVGMGTIELALKRMWESAAIPARRFTLRIRVST